MARRIPWKKLVIAGSVVGAGGLGTFIALPSVIEHWRSEPLPVMPLNVQKDLAKKPLPSRQRIHESLKKEEFDVLIIGGGATGCGIALDATTRGLNTALVEKYDFSSGTSSRSTKLIHGGVRYLQKAVFNLDIEQFRMVTEALSERANMLQCAPHLAYPLPIMLPVYKWYLVPYYWVGIKLYDIVAGTEMLKPSYFLNKTKSLEAFPMLKKEKLVGALVYYDGQQDDSRMNISLAMTSIRMGGALTNHVEVLNLLKTSLADGSEKISGAHVRDMLTGEEWDIKAKCVVNATGPYTDHIRLMSSSKTKKICQPSSGVHIVLPDYYSPDRMGLLDPSTSDGRVIFFLPWLKHTLAGTTDSACEVTDYPSPTEKEVQFILQEIRNYLNTDVKVRRGDVCAAWSGMRPLVSDPNKTDTQSISRNHVIEVDAQGLITIAGGKWTTYRRMAEETVDAVVKNIDTSTKTGCQTRGLLVEGAHTWSPTMFIRLLQDIGLENEVAQHLAQSYGDKAFEVAKLCTLTGKRWPVHGVRLHPELPYIEAEVRYAVKEYACSAVDVIARRTRLSFLNAQAAEAVYPRVIEILANEFGWSPAKIKDEHEHCRRFLKREMGLELKGDVATVPITLSVDEVNDYTKLFQKMDKGKKGYITTSDLQRCMEEKGERVSLEQLHDILSEVDINQNAEVDLGEFLQALSLFKSGQVTHGRLAAFAKNKAEKDKIPVERSGGGV